MNFVKTIAPPLKKNKESTQADSSLLQRDKFGKLTALQKTINTLITND